MKTLRSTKPMPPAVDKELRHIPGIGPSLAQDLFDLGVEKISSLRRRNPENLYHQLCTLRGEHQDRCVLYVFRCAVYFAKEAQPDPELLKWWNWKDDAASFFAAAARGNPKRGLRLLGKLNRLDQKNRVAGTKP